LIVASRVKSFGRGLAARAVIRLNPDLKQCIVNVIEEGDRL